MQRKKCMSLSQLTLVTAVTVIVGGCTSVLKTGKATPGGGQAVLGRVSEVRRTLRAACSQLKAINAEPEESEGLLSKARTETERAMKLWVSFIGASGKKPPRPYVTHPNWHAAVQDIQAGIAEMLQHIEVRDPALAFTACGRTCGKFVALNEAAGVRRTSDILFHFRKAAKPLAGELGSEMLSKVAAALPKLVEIRNEAMVRPGGGTGTASEKEAALRAFSDAVDRFGEAVGRGNTDNLSALYGQVMRAMEKAYDLFL